jgi:lysozyme
MKINAAGLELIKNFEGLSLSPYKDAAGLWTIGYGHLIRDHEFFRPLITQPEADELLIRDLAAAESAVSALCKVPLTSNQFSALVSFVFNLGATRLQSSTLLRLVNQGQHDLAACQFLRWTKAGGRELPGLLRRRRAEAKLYLTPDFSASINHP